MVTLLCLSVQSAVLAMAATESSFSHTSKKYKTCPPFTTWNMAAVNRNSILSNGCTYTLLHWGPSLHSCLQISAGGLANHHGLTFEPLRKGKCYSRQGSRWGSCSFGGFIKTGVCWGDVLCGVAFHIGQIPSRN